jgi:3-oxoadipate enol-lactonase
MTDVHFAASGPEDAPVLVLGGSLGTTLAMWDRLVPLLAGRLRVVRYDGRGHGRSPVPEGPYSMADLGADVVALLDRLGVEHASYCGVSIGGMVAQWLGAHAPDRIERLVVCCSASYLPDGGFTERAATVRELGGTATIADAIVGRWLTPPYAEAHPELRAWLTEMLVSSPAEGYAGCCEAIAGMDLRPVLSKITAPTLVVAGADDPAIPPRYAGQIAGSIPGSRLVVLEHAAHLASVEQAETVNLLLVDWFGG